MQARVDFDHCPEHFVQAGLDYARELSDMEDDAGHQVMVPRIVIPGDGLSRVQIYGLGMFTWRELPDDG
jgi:hypothetical protein